MGTRPSVYPRRLDPRGSEARQGEHEVTLLTLADPDLDERNASGNTNVHDVTRVVERAGTLAPWLHERYGLKSYILQNALLGRHARGGFDEFHLLVSLDNREHIFHSTVEGDSFYERLCTTVGVRLRRRSGSNGDDGVPRRRSRAPPRW